MKFTEWGSKRQKSWYRQMRRKERKEYQDANNIGWDFKSLFEFSDGAWYDLQPPNVYADTSLSSPAVIAGGIAGIGDLSGNGYHATQPTSTARPIYQTNPDRAVYDGADDVLPANLTIPSITNGTFILVGSNGVFIDSEYTNTSLSLSVGPTTYTNGPEGILAVVGDLLAFGFLDRQLTESEVDKVRAAGVKRGAPGLFQWGDEIVGDPEFDDPSYWITDGNISITGGQCVFEEVTNVGDYCFRAGLLTYPGYFRAVWNVSSLSGGYINSTVGQGTGGSLRSASEAGSFVHYAHLPEPAALNRLRISRATGETPVNATIDSVSLRKLELIP